MAYFLSLVVLILAISVIYFTYTPESEDSLIDLNASYDYIIIGAGSAGCVLANRLSEDQTSKVLLVEAGGSEKNNPNLNVPLAHPIVQNTAEDWAFRTVPQKKACLALKDQKCAWPRGKVLGGTSNLNGMHYIRGSRYDYDVWAKEGCDGWSYKDVLPYFIKSEDIRVKHLQNSEYHGRGGPLAVSDGVSTYLNLNVYGEGMKELGYNVIDCNGKSQIGFCSAQETVGGGERWSTAKGFLRPSMNRNNLHVTIKSHVTKIVIVKKKAVGVEFVRDGKKHAIKANKEVILSAGAVSSPQILMLSGIGPKDHLTSLGIPVVADLPVGDNLQDHIMLAMRFWDTSGSSVTVDKTSSFTSYLQYLLFRTGVSSKTALEASAFFSDSETQQPYIQIHFNSVSLHPIHSDVFIKNWNYNEKMAKYIKEAIQKVHDNNLVSFFLLPTLLRPKSKGNIRLRSKDPFDPPLIDPNYLDHPDDVKTFLRGIRKTLELSNTTAFRNIGASPGDALEEDLPYCKDYPLNSDAFWICRMRHLTLTVYHPTSTCRMGAKNDPTAVVDPQLRVQGVDGLRVADASVMRDVPSGNTNAPTIMIGEKASDLIRGIDSIKAIRDKTLNL